MATTHNDFGLREIRFVALWRFTVIAIRTLQLQLIRKNKQSRCGNSRGRGDIGIAMEDGAPGKREGGGIIGPGD